MRRREFTAGLLLIAGTLPARAQQRPIPRIALFHSAIPTAFLTETGGGTAWRAFFQELRRPKNRHGRFRDSDLLRRLTPLCALTLRQRRYLVSLSRG